ncbi:hypothetical protein BX600DRAFT_516966 [Xylariales sp. PMI_506]|nr:hypothetical protein BX600DRAFT_516966 [Xylariales sp. PMI_506]
MATNTTDMLQSQDLSEVVSRWNAQIKEVWGNKETAATLTLVAAAADAIEQRIGSKNDADWTEDERNALMAVKRFTYNAAADAWPGWELDTGTVLDNDDDKPASEAAAAALLAEGKRTAQRSVAVTRRLKLGDILEATGTWLVGAFDLALGDLDAAVDGFADASQQYKHGSAPGLMLLADGYGVIAKGLRARQPPENIACKLEEEVNTRLLTGGYEDGAEWAEQLRTALKVFSYSK